MRKLLHTPLPQIEDPGLKAMVSELQHACKVRPAEHCTLFGYVWQCVYPWGTEKRYPIDRHRIVPGRMLSRKIGKLQDTGVYRFCHEVAMMQNQSAELVANMTLYVFLNRYLPDLDKKKKPKPFDPRDIM